MQIHPTDDQQAGEGRASRELDVAVSDLFLPDHLRLGAYNWHEFKLAIEAVLRLKGIPLAHLKCAYCLPPVSRECSATNGADHRDNWAADDELCKTITMLNVRSDHVRLAGQEHEGYSAAKVWALLMQRHEDVQKEWERKIAWLECVRALAPWMFLAVVCTASLMTA